MQAVLASLQSHTTLEHQEALIALEQAHGRLSELQRERDELAERAAAAERQAAQLQASARHEWSAMRDELSGLVQQAEAAQLGAEATAQRQQEQFEARLAVAAREAAEAAAGRAAAEAAADELRRQLGAAQQQLADAQRRLAEQEAALRGSLDSSQAGVQQLEAQVAAMQKQLAARMRGKGTSVEAAKKAAAASGAAGLAKQENRQLRAQVEGLQEQVGWAGGWHGLGVAALPPHRCAMRAVVVQSSSRCCWSTAFFTHSTTCCVITQPQVKLLEAHVRHGVAQLRAAKELSEAAQRSIADAGARLGPLEGARLSVSMEQCTWPRTVGASSTAPAPAQPQLPPLQGLPRSHFPTCRGAGLTGRGAAAQSGRAQGSRRGGAAAGRRGSGPPGAAGEPVGRKLATAPCMACGWVSTGACTIASSRFPPAFPLRGYRICPVLSAPPGLPGPGVAEPAGSCAAPRAGGAGGGGATEVGRAGCSFSAERDVGVAGALATVHMPARQA